jgi:transcription termination factor Rho
LSETDLVSTAPARKRGLSGMVLAELRQLAGELNIPDTTGMRKGDLIAAIKERQSGGSAPQLTLPDPAGASRAPAVSSDNGTATAPVATVPAAAAPAEPAPVAAASSAAAPTADVPKASAPRRRRAASRPAGAPDPQPGAEAPAATSASADAGHAQEAPAAQATTNDAGTKNAGSNTAGTNDAGTNDAGTNDAGTSASGEAAEGGGRRQRQRRRPDAAQTESAPADTSVAEQAPAADAGSRADAGGRADAGTRAEERAPRENRRTRGGGDVESGRDGSVRDNSGRDGGVGRGDRGEGNRGEGRNEGRGDTRPDSNGGNRADSRVDSNRPDNTRPRDNRPDDNDDEDGDGRGRRGRRFRDRRRGRDRQPTGTGTGQGGARGDVDTEVREGDVLLPVAGIVDILDNYAFVRTTGYLSGPTDVYVSLSMVRKYGLRRGDAVTGAVREQREGEQSRQKFNPLVRIDSINGQDPEVARRRPEFTKLTPLYPNERLRLETESHKLTTRVIDLVMPIGKGQRALIVSPPKAGKTTIMQNIANAITTNNPECHLMVVLVDERPEEVTDMQRSVKGEVIASTFDRPPTDHTTIAELSIERAKRLVEMGHDVVVLLDNITRLGRAYNLAAPASGRILSGGVDSTALYPPKRFLGAARNIEDGGSLTILATALVETGSTMDTVIFEEFKGTGNAELKLDRRIADKRVFPAIDVGDSGTRKEELLMSADEYAVMVKLRRLLSALDDQQAIDLLLTQLKKTKTNIEFLMQVAKGMPVGGED